MSSHRSPRRRRTAPRGVIKHCDTCFYPKRVVIYGNTTQARQAAQALHPGDEVELCTNSNGGVHLRQLAPVVIPEEMEE